MPIDVQCPGCERVVTFGDETAGRQGRCPECNERMKIPRTSLRRRLLLAGSSRRATMLWTAAVGVVLLVVLGGVGAIYFRHTPKGEDEPTPSSSKKTPPPPSSQRGPLPRIGDFASAQEIKLDGNGAANQKGRFQTTEDVDVYRFNAPVNGRMTVRQKGLPGDNPDCRLTAYDADQKELKTDNTRELSFRVTADETYYLKVAASGKAGAYELTLGLQVDDFGDTFETAERIALDTSGFAYQEGRIDFPGDEDMFRFEATVTGKLMLLLDRRPGDHLNSILTVYNDKRQKMGQSAAEEGKTFAVVYIDVLKGRTYYALVAGNRSKAESETGLYSLSILTTAPESKPVRSGFDTAQRVELSKEGSLTRTGRIAKQGDENYYRFTAPVTGTMTVQQEAAEKSSLDSVLFAYDDQQTEIAHNDDASISTFDSRVEFPVVAGRTYYLKAAGQPSGSGGVETATGEYRLVITTASAVPRETTQEPEDWTTLLTYLASGSNALVGVDVNLLLSHPRLAPLLTQLGADGFKEVEREAGLDVKQIEYAILAFELHSDLVHKDELTTDHMTLVVQGKKRLDTDRMRQVLGAGPAQQRDGKTYYVLTPKGKEDPQVLYLPTEQVAVLSSLPEARVGEILRAPRKAPVLAPDLLGTVYGLGKPAAWAVLPPALLKQILAKPDLPPLFRPFLELLDKGKTVWISVWLQDDHLLIRAGVIVEDADTARQLQSTFKESWKSATEDLEAMVAKQPPQLQPLYRALGTNLLIFNRENEVRLSVRIDYEALEKAGQR